MEPPAGGQKAPASPAVFPKARQRPPGNQEQNAFLFHNPLPSFVVSADNHRILDANPAFLSLAGLTTGDFLGTPLSGLPLWADPERCERALKQAGFGRPLQNALVAVHNGKGPREFLLSASLLPRENRLFCSLTEVTDYVRQKEDSELEIKVRELKETNDALRILLNQSREEAKRLKQRILSNVEDLVLPYLYRMKETPLDADQQVCLAVAEHNLSELVSPFMRHLGNQHANLTPREIEVANLVRMGTTSREIARLLNISKRAVEFHRDSLRSKLGLKRTKQNLRAYLSSMS
ncbi:MAG: PAS domain-containing protein [Deltaproteobacteria bacterium]|nr:PAS domain-containing protein [Deltaproteobacteria bacterium]